MIKIIFLKKKKDLFYHFFTVGNVYNDCCYECKYRDSSMADIRVGDYSDLSLKIVLLV